MKIPESVIAQQLVRFSRMARWSEDTGMVDEIAKALRCCDDTGHCVQTVDAWIRQSRWAPTPADIYETAEANPATLAVSEQRDRSCAGCSGTGFEHGWELVTYTHVGDSCHKSVDLIFDPEVVARIRAGLRTKDQMLYEGVRRCRQCGYGRALATAEVERKGAGSQARRLTGGAKGAA